MRSRKSPGVAERAPVAYAVAMFALDRVTLSGVDHTLSPADLTRLLDACPPDRVELGLLASRDRAGTPRYPDPATACAIAGLARSRGALVSAHLCGGLARDVEAAAWSGTASADAVLGEWGGLLHLVGRVQVNLPEPDATPDLARAVRRLLGKPTIFQLRRPAQAMGAEALAFPDIPEGCHWLLDASAGRGVPLDVRWAPRPVRHRLVGYAGGLGPDNVAAAAAFLRGAAETVGGRVWLDMETGLRVRPGARGDYFDPDRALAVVEAVRPLLGGSP